VEALARPDVERSKLVTWTDPLAAADAAVGMTGLEAMTAIKDGTLPPPPIASLLGFEIDELEPGRVVFSVVPGEEHYNPIGLVHGGLAATLLDTVTGCAVHTELAAGDYYATLDLQAHYTRPMTRDTGKVLAIGEVVHAGSTVATAEGRLIGAENGKLYAHGTSTLLLTRATAR
jgi:uncharacterized protein (TIGR00369 family)